MSITYSDILPQLFDTLGPFTKEGMVLEEKTELITELGLDSIQVMQILLKIEDYFDISIPLNHLPKIRTVQDLGLVIEKLLNK